jgi:hypothetical protein
MEHENITHVRLSLDVDNYSHGYDETFTAEEISNAGGIERLIEDYIDYHVYEIMEIHNLDENEEIENPRQYVDVTEWYEGEE